ncbi:hypothetical protein OG218_07470 [Kineococcus sp. NBC_00420]|uniref:hypothetical protein n=1 Tax=Kineococcus sp. NBC_00420 TaxID=2903564 RepID=UPI002E21B3B4
MAAELLLLAFAIWGLAEGRVVQTVVGALGALISAVVIVRITVRSHETSAGEVENRLRLNRALLPYISILSVVFAGVMIAATVVSSPWWLVGVAPAVALPLACVAQIRHLRRLHLSRDPEAGTAQ